MDWLPVFLVSLFLLTIIWLIISNLRLQRRLDQYSSSIKKTEQADPPGEALPVDVPGLEVVSNAVHSLVEVLQARLHKSEKEHARLADVLTQMTDGVLIVGDNGRIEFANPAATRLFHTREPVGRSAVEVLHQYQLVQAWQKSLSTGEPQEESIEVPASRQFLQMISLPDRQTGGSLLVVHDLTRVRRLETVRRDFISNVSHELRTPLASLKALAETLRDGALSDSEAAPRFLGRIETEVDALTQMTQELLDLTRIESGQVALNYKNVIPEQILKSVCDRMRAQVERAGLELSLDLHPDLPPIRADAGRLEQVLVNLVHNAIKFTTPGGLVTMSASFGDPMVRFSVKDNGIGIPDDDLERIFERFYKSDRSRSGGGTGLGLSIARNIVEAHGGRIWVESVEGRGSTFFFTIPIS